MYFLTVFTVTLIAAVSALPGPAPIITDAPVRKEAPSGVTTDCGSAVCTSTDCWYSYAECNGSLIFVSK
ncbi:hypothetical protein F5Y19DRAFT_426087 [Xylariaceae sp. FL1651]|nr:hypothetical protein F5Y19DRAFT_426087 [Xylariaceae sp. FL1651]